MPTNHGKPPPPYSAGNGNAAPAGLDVLLVGLLEPVGRLHGVVARIVHAALDVAGAVERRDHVRHEASVLVEDALHGVEVGVRERRRARASRGDVDEVVEHEGDVAERRSVVSHRGPG